MKDERRDADMEKLGLRVLRFEGSEIFEHPDECASKIREEIEHLPVEARNAAYLPAGQLRER